MSKQALEAVTRALEEARNANPEETERATGHALAQTLWAIRQPDDTYRPCTWVTVYTWRGPGFVIVITELEGMNRIHRRVSGWVLPVNGSTLYIDQHRTPNETAIQMILEAISNQPKP